MGVAGWRFAHNTKDNRRAVVIAILDTWPLICTAAVAACAMTMMAAAQRECQASRGLRLSYRTSSEAFLRESGRMRSRTHTARRCVDRPVWPTIHDARGRNVGRAAAALILITPF
jgi:hypothetical protein